VWSASPTTIAATSTTYISLSLRVVAMNTGPVVRRRYTRMPTPAKVENPAMPPSSSACTW
jgi:hypothetical protein